MELRDLAALVSLADSGAFRRTARIIGVNPATLSRRIAGFEDELGILLFDRGPQGITLTSAGRELLSLARRITDDAASLKENARRAGTAQVGCLRLASQLSFLGPRLRSLIARFRALHSNVALELSEVSDREAIDGLLDSRFDVALLFEPTIMSTVESLSMWREPLVLAVPEQHPLAALQGVKWSSIRKEQVLVRGWVSSIAFQSFVAGLIGSAGLVRSHRVGCAELMDLVAIGEGVMVALASHEEICPPSVRLVRIDESDAAIGISLAWSPALEDPVAGSFVALTRDFNWSSHDVA